METIDHRNDAKLEYYTGLAQYYPSTRYFFTLADRLGSIKGISSVRSGKFIPGKFRANPCQIYKSSCYQSNETDFVCPYRRSGRAYLSVMKGPVAALLASYLVNPSWPQAFSVPWDNSLANSSYYRVYSKVGEPEFDLGVFLAEIPETLAGLPNLLGASRKYIKQLQKLKQLTVREWQKNKYALIKFQKGHYTLSMLGGSWLEWRMAISPTLRDIEDLKEQVWSSNEKINTEMQRCRAGVGYGSEPSGGGKYLWSNFVLEGKYFKQVNIKTTSVLYYLQNRPITFSERFGLDLASLPSIAWELVPLSFIVDRFIGIGDMISSLRGFTDSRTVLGLTTSQKAYVDTSVMLTHITPSALPSAVPVTGTYSFCSEELVRNVNLTPSAIPSINRRPLSFMQQVDHISLLWQRFFNVNWNDLISCANRADRELRKVGKI